ncbi:MAG: hypothetical protein SNF33_03130 [Candidatus Algichlamydia australiensis]|nr:hypothetical protein [Chlamydiales bacterium]
MVMPVHRTVRDVDSSHPVDRQKLSKYLKNIKEKISQMQQNSMETDIALYRIKKRQEVETFTPREAYILRFFDTKLEYEKEKGNPPLDWDSMYKKIFG